MANNINTNLASRLFAYIEHNVDITDNIKSIYENSMIFIGDEQQILIPKFNAYVGIGMSSYNSIFAKINEIQNDIANFQNDLGSYAVKSINVQWASGSVNSLYPTLNASDYRRLYGEITLASLDDYNPETGFAYRGSKYSYVADYGTWQQFGNEDTTKPLVNASSGISLTYYYDEEDYVTPDGTVLKRPVNNRIVIDDKKTWSYMTNAYTYSMNFSRNYTNERIETLYHDILGVGDSILVPISGADIVEYDNVSQQNVLAEGKYVYWVGNGSPVMPDSTTINSWVSGTTPTGNWKLVTTVPSNLEHSYYSISTNYNNTYNINISDGIQTLKEIAYILDVLSDGTLGSKKYIDKSTWSTLTGNSGANSVTVGGVSYYRVISANGEPTTNVNQYAYYVVIDTDAENLGIQMAYSIADNNSAIQDLHYHIELNEEGQTSLRSIGHYNLPNSLVSMYQLSNVRNIRQTDTEQSIDNPGEAALTTYTYTLGDTRLYTRLDLATTYVSYNNNLNAGVAGSLDESVTDNLRYGYFEKVDYVEHLHNTSLRNNGTTYYQRESNGTFTIINPANWAAWPSTIEDAMTEATYLYWINPETVRTSYQYANETFTYVDYNDVLDNPSHNYYIANNGRFELTQNTSNQNLKYYVMDRELTGVDEQMFVQQAVIDGANHIATTTWTMAFVKDINQSVSGKVENVLEEAKKYTDSRIDALDNNSMYSYANFYTYWAQNGPSSATPGTITYENAAAAKFEEWVNWLNSLTLYDTLSVGASYSSNYTSWRDGSYTYNTSRSEYIVNIVQEDGKVTTQTRELPTDMVEVSYNIWNSQQNGVQYTPLIVNIPSTDDDTDAATAFIEALFDAIYDETTHTHKTIYAKNGTDKAKQKIAAADLNQNITFYVMNNDGTFSIASTETIRSVRNNDTGSIYYKQLYKEVDALYEVKLDSITLDSTNVNNINHYIAHATILTPNGEVEIAITQPAAGTTGNFTTNLYEATQASSESNKVKYISGSVEHYKYDQEGGAGQNKVKLDLNITRIEDATFNNTGFADAYDVREYIQNMFTWVNISASVTQSQLESTDGFYKLYPLQSETSADFEAKVAGRKIYVRKTTGGTVQYVEVLDENGTSQNGTYTMTYIGKDSNGNYVTDNTALPGSKHYELTYGGNHVCITYITNQVANINPLNMELTRVR